MQWVDKKHFYFFIFNTHKPQDPFFFINKINKLKNCCESLSHYWFQQVDIAICKEMMRGPDRCFPNIHELIDKAIRSIFCRLHFHGEFLTLLTIKRPLPQG